MVTSTGMVGLELNLSSSGKYASALEQFSSEEEAFFKNCSKSNNRCGRCGGSLVERTSL
jgi:hypothetical protein